MTVLTRASDLRRKQDPSVPPRTRPQIPDPTINMVFQECTRHSRPRSVTVAPTRPSRVWVYRSQCTSFTMWLTMLMTLMLLVGAVLGLMFLSQLNDVAKSARFRGYCAIPVEVAETPRGAPAAATAPPSRMPLRWSEDEGELSVFTDQANSLAGNSLLERFDIDNNVEKISVYNSGRNIEFIHDFNSNASSIVDNERCFVMSLDPETVLRPSVFVMSISRGEPFDVMRVRVRARVLLPPAAPPAALLAERCLDARTYRLDKTEGNVRKRSTDKDVPDYVHFAGKHISEISIDNLAELLEYEKKMKAT